MYIALKYLIKSGALNVIDTAINYRCQKSERIIGAVISNLTDDELNKSEIFKITREMLFVASKTGYVPEDGDKMIS